MNEKRKHKEPNQPAGTEKFKVVLISVLALAILAGTFVVFWQIQRQNPTKNQTSTENEQLKTQLDDLNKKIDSLNKAVEDAKNQQTTSTTSTKTTSKSTSSVKGASTSSGSSSQVSGKVNLNSASASQLDTLPGIGATYAQRIIDYRNTNGGFKSIDEIQNVKGIGPATFAKMKDLITI
jgi:comEA protein